MFGRKANGTNGFSIDVPVQLSTMLASRFIVLKVVNEKDEHLICKDIRKGAPPQVVSINQRGVFLAYMDVGKDALEEDSDEANCKEVREESKSANLRRGEAKVEKVLHLTIQEFTFKKVLLKIANTSYTI